MAEAAALPLTSITAWELLFDRLGVARSQDAQGTLLVTGGAGGVGSILIQLARQLTGLTIVATASRPETRDWCLELGAHHVIDHSVSLVDGFRGIGLDGAELVASLTQTATHYPAIVELLKPQGRLALIDDPKTLDAMPLKQKSASLHWELMFARPVFETPDMIAQHDLLTEVAGLVDAGTIRTTLTSPFGRIDAATLRRAHAQLESGTTRGKIVLEGF
jgi:NADPH2:quinone reductase